MANYYVKSGAAGTADGSSWTNAYTTLAAALTARSAGDVFWVSHQHAETQASAITLTSPGTAASPCLVLCVNDGATPPTALAATATVTTTGASNLRIDGCAFFYGIIFTAGDASNAASLSIGTLSSLSQILNFENCSLRSGGNNSNTIILGRSAGGTPQLFRLVNTTFSFANAFAVLQHNGGRVLWLNTLNALLGTVPAVLWNSSSALGGSLDVVGVDLSAAGSGKTIISLTGTNTQPSVFARCKLAAAVTLFSGTISGPGGRMVTFIDCDSANTNYRYSRTTYMGTETHETTVVRTSGATDGTTPVSRKMVSTSVCRFTLPMDSQPIEYWCDSTSAQTITIPVITDGVTLTNGDAWIELDYLGTASFPLGLLASGKGGDALTPGSTALATDSTSTWGAGPVSPIKQSLTVTFTPASKGWVSLRVMLARASTTLYYDPKAIAGARQYQAGSSFINEPAGGGGGGGSIFGSSIITPGGPF